VLAYVKKKELGKNSPKIEKTKQKSSRFQNEVQTLITKRFKV
jgi:hypothetical protein